MLTTIADLKTRLQQKSKSLSALDILDKYAAWHRKSVFVDPSYALALVAEKNNFEEFLPEHPELGRLKLAEEGYQKTYVFVSNYGLQGFHQEYGESDLCEISSTAYCQPASLEVNNVSRFLSPKFRLEPFISYSKNSRGKFDVRMNELGTGEPNRVLPREMDLGEVVELYDRNRELSRPLPRIPLPASSLRKLIDLNLLLLHSSQLSFDWSSKDETQEVYFEIEPGELIWKTTPDDEKRSNASAVFLLNKGLKIFKK